MSRRRCSGLGIAGGRPEGLTGIMQLLYGSSPNPWSGVLRQDGLPQAMEHGANVVQEDEKSRRRWRVAQLRGQNQVGAQFLGGGAAGVVVAGLVLETGPQEPLRNAARD